MIKIGKRKEKWEIHKSKLWKFDCFPFLSFGIFLLWALEIIYIDSCLKTVYLGLVHYLELSYQSLGSIEYLFWFLRRWGKWLSTQPIMYIGTISNIYRFFYITVNVLLFKSYVKSQWTLQENPNTNFVQMIAKFWFEILVMKIM